MILHAIAGIIFLACAVANLAGAAYAIADLVRMALGRKPKP